METLGQKGLTTFSGDKGAGLGYFFIFQVFVVMLFDSFAQTDGGRE